MRDFRGSHSSLARARFSRSNCEAGKSWPLSNRRRGLVSAKVLRLRAPEAMRVDSGRRVRPKKFCASRQHSLAIAYACTHEAVVRLTP